MDTPGTVLRSERERQQKTLKDVARKLKINIKYLEAIEDDDYSVLPAEVFARSYIRLYADELDLDSGKLLVLFEAMRKAPVPDMPKPEETPAPASPPGGEERKKSLKPFMGIAAAGVLILIIAIMVLKQGETPEKPSAVDLEPAVQKTKPAEMKEDRSAIEAAPAVKKAGIKDTKPVRKPDTPPVVEKKQTAAQPLNPLKKEEPSAGKPPAPDTEEPPEKTMPAPREEKPAPEQILVREEDEPAVQSLPAVPEQRSAPVQAASEKDVMVDEAPAPSMIFEQPPGALTLVITATELTWASLSIDGGKPKEWHLRPGETITLTGENGFRGKIGNAGGTKLLFNGRDLGELGPPGKIIDISLP